MRTWKKRLVTLVPGCLGVVASLVAPLQVAAQPLYSVGGHVHTNVPGSGVYRVEPPNVERVYLSDSATMVGSGNNVALAEYEGSLATGALTAQARATRGWNGESWEPARAATSVHMFDVLHFTVPAGSYPTGLYAEASGSVSGSVGKSGGGTEARTQYQAWFGGLASQYFGQVVLSSIDPDQVVVIDERFELSAVLVNPGTELSGPLAVDVPIFAGLGNAAALGASTWSLPRVEAAWAHTDFLNTLRFTSVTPPAGVSWTSASGVFLSAIPAPAAAWLFASGVVVLVSARWKRRGAKGGISQEISGRATTL